MKRSQRRKLIIEGIETPTQIGIFEDFFATGYGSHEKHIIEAVCKRHRISQSTFYKYYSKFAWKDRVKQRALELVAAEKAKTTEVLLKRRGHEGR